MLIKKINIFLQSTGGHEYSSSGTKQEKHSGLKTNPKTDKINTIFGKPENSEKPEKPENSENSENSENPEKRAANDRIMAWLRQYEKNTGKKNPGKKNVDNTEKKELNESLKKKTKEEILRENLLKPKKEEIEKAKQELLKENPSLKGKELETQALDLVKEKNKELLKQAEEEILDENPELKHLGKDKLEDLARKTIFKNKIKVLEEKDESGISKYEQLLKENPELKNINKMGEKLGKEVIAVYGKELANAYGKLLSSLPEDKFPKTLEEFDQLVKIEYAKKYYKERNGDAIADAEGEKDIESISKKEVAQAVKQQIYNPKAVNNLSSNYSTINNNFEKGNMNADLSKLKEITDKLPEGKIKNILTSGYQKASEGWSEKGNHKKELDEFIGFDTAKTPWCKGYVNAECRANNIPYTKSLAAKSGLNMGNKVNEKELLPGDLVIVSRKGGAGGHIGFYVGMSENGHPIILGGNQGKEGTISLKEEKRPVLGFRRIASEEESKKIKESISGENKNI